jgi:hypothetical protein
MIKFFCGVSQFLKRNAKEEITHGTDVYRRLILEGPTLNHKHPL